jgi:exopolysaccharide biosynthesis polyprenyl glycosylphosphotransferase
LSKPKEENWKKFLQNKIIIIDFIVLFISIFVILFLRFPEILKGEIKNYEIRNIIVAFLVYILWLFFLSLNGSRDLKILGFGADEYKRLTSSTLLSFTSIAFISYIFKLEISRAFVLLVFPIGLFSLFLSRRILRKNLLKDRLQGKYLSKVLLVISKDVDPVEARLNLAQHAGFKIILKFQINSKKDLDVKKIISEAQANQCDKIIIGQSASITAEELRILGWALEKTNIDLVVAPAVTEIAGPRLKVSNVEGLPLLHLEQPSFSGFARFIKRMLDVSLTILGLILISPILIIISILIKTFDSGSIFYKQKRIGQNNKEFIVYKFRTMHEGSHELREKAMEGINKDPRLSKNPQDPRITKPGLFLRRWSIDEIPQLINVLKGEMSLVGPRPPLVEEVTKYEHSEKRRLLVKPGLTGLWQVSGRSELDWEDAVRLDLYYIENWSLTLDLLIIIRTFAAVLRGEGAY